MIYDTFSKSAVYPKHFDYLYIYTYTCVRHVSCIIESLVISRVSLSLRPGYAEVPVSG